MDYDHKIKYLEDKINDLRDQLYKTQVEIIKFTPWCTFLTIWVVVIFILCLKK